MRIGSLDDVLSGNAQIGVHHGSMDQLFNAVANASVEAIITDPPYFKKYHLLYKECHDWAAFILKEHGDLMMILPHWMLDPFDQVGMPHGDLRYRWTLMMDQREGSYARLCNGHRNIAVTWKPIGWWYKFGPKPNNYAGTFDSYVNPEPDKQHPWQQSDAWADFCIDHMYHTDGLIIDPMAGSGTVGIRAALKGYNTIIGDTDPECIHLMMKRIGDAFPDAQITTELANTLANLKENDNE